MVLECYGNEKGILVFLVKDDGTSCLKQSGRLWPWIENEVG